MYFNVKLTIVKKLFFKCPKLFYIIIHVQYKEIHNFYITMGKVISCDKTAIVSTVNNICNYPLLRVYHNINMK